MGLNTPTASERARIIARYRKKKQARVSKVRIAMAIKMPSAEPSRHNVALKERRDRRLDLFAAHLADGRKIGEACRLIGVSGATGTIYMRTLNDRYDFGLTK